MLALTRPRVTEAWAAQALSASGGLAIFNYSRQRWSAPRCYPTRKIRVQMLTAILCIVTLKGGGPAPCGAQRVQAATLQAWPGHKDTDRAHGRADTGHTGQRSRQAGTDTLREAQTARPRHLVACFQKHGNEEPRLQDPEGAGLGNKRTPDFTATLEATRTTQRVPRETTSTQNPTTRLPCKCAQNQHTLC